MSLAELHRTTRSGFTLVEIMIVVAIIALLSAIAIPSWLRARKRTQAVTIYDDLRLIDSAVDQYALEANLGPGDPVNSLVWQRFFFKTNMRLYETGNNVLGHPYGDQYVDSLPTIPQASWQALADVAAADFWSPFQVAPAP